MLIELCVVVGEVLQPSYDVVFVMGALLSVDGHAPWALHKYSWIGV